MSDTTTTPPDEWVIITGKALIASKSPWGTVAGGLLAWLVAHYGLDWDQTTCNMIAGLGVLLASYGMRWLTTKPITGIMTPKPMARKYAKYVKAV